MTVTASADELNQKGLAFAQAQDWPQAKTCFEQAVIASPVQAHFHNNLGNVLSQLLLFSEALQAYQQAIDLQPRYELAHQNLALTFMQLERYEAASAQFLCVLEINPQSWTALFQLSNLNYFLKNHSQALHYVDQCLVLEPLNLEALQNKFTFQTLLGEGNAAVDTLKRILSIDPQHKIALFHLAKYGLGQAPSTAPTQYVQNLFDNYAGHFEEELVTHLNYQTPVRIGQIVKDLKLCSDKPAQSVLDLGCGTGLVGAQLSVPATTKMVGVDLASKMLKVAATKGCYSQLVHAEIESYLSGCQEQFQLVTSADVFIYIGNLERIFANVNRVLLDDGWFIFSVELLAQSTYALLGSGRYAHSKNYLIQLASQHKFKIEYVSQEVIRHDGSTPIQGLVMALQKT